MTLKHKYILLLVLLFLIPSAKSAETLFLYQGSLNRKIKIEELYEFKKTKIPSNKLKNIRSSNRIFIFRKRYYSKK